MLSVGKGVGRGPLARVCPDLTRGRVCETREAQARTEEVLAGQMAGTPLIEQRWGHMVSTISQDKSGVTLTCNTVDGEVELWAPYVVLALPAPVKAS